MENGQGRSGHRFRRRLEGALGVPATEGNEVDVLRNGDEIFPAMLEEIGRAQHTVDFLTFIYWTGDIAVRFADALADRARHGVRVRVLLDALGSRHMDPELVERMEGAGCDVRRFRAVDDGELGQVNRRTHRKVLICDEEVSFTGGVGIAQEWCGDARDHTEWRDTHFRLRGPATDGLRAAFLENWAETGGPLLELGLDRFPVQPQDGRFVVQVVRGASETGWGDIGTLFELLVRLAERRLRICTAYFTPDEPHVAALCDAAERGVAVELLVPGPHADKRFVQLGGEEIFERLLSCGIEVSCFRPAMLHAKALTVDGEVATVGSANYNGRSTSYDEEVNLVLFDRELVATLDRHFEADRARSDEIDLGQWQDRSLVQRAGEQVVRMIRPFM